MAQSDLNVQNADGATVRADINSQLEALATRHSGSTAPPVVFPYMRWFDTASLLLMERNGANTAWRTIGEIVDGEFVPYSAGESAEARYARLASANTFAGSNEFSIMPTVAGAPLVESDSNSNGEYARWADGTQLATGVTSHPFNSSTTSQTVLSVFPMPFDLSAHPVRIAGGGKGGDTQKMVVPSYGTVVSTEVPVVAINAAGVSLNESRITEYTATGRWK